MTILHGLLLGLIEGLTEFLPISSTAHLILVGEWLRIPQTDFLKSFEISIQLGAILAVVILYWKKIWSSWKLIGKIAAAFIPTSIIGLILYKAVKSYLMENNYLIATALLLGGIVLIVFESWNKKNKTPESGKALEDLTYGQAAVIGVFQSLAIIPGVSRAAATIIGGLSLGVKRKDIVEFSFLLAVPTMAAATALDLYKTPPVLSGNELTIWISGFLASFATAIIGVKFFMKFIQKNDFIPFGWYRIFLGIAVLLWLFI